MIADHVEMHDCMIMMEMLLVVDIVVLTKNYEIAQWCPTASFFAAFLHEVYTSHHLVVDVTLLLLLLRRPTRVLPVETFDPVGVVDSCFSLERIVLPVLSYRRYHP